MKRGDRVVLYLENSVELVVGIFATLKAGGVFVAINATTKPDRLLYILNNCQATALILRGRQATLVQQTRQSVPSLKAVIVASPVG